MLGEEEDGETVLAMDFTEEEGGCGGKKWLIMVGGVLAGFGLGFATATKLLK